MSSPDDARDTFRVARCNVKKFAIVYLAWAQFELSQGETVMLLLNQGGLEGGCSFDIIVIQQAWTGENMDLCTKPGLWVKHNI